MLREGILVGYWVPKLGENGTCRKGAWRILDPGIKFTRYLEDSRRHIEHVPLLSGREVAQVLQVTSSAIRQLRRRKRIEGQKVRKTVLYTAAEIRKVLFERERRSGRRKRTSYSPVLVRWLEQILGANQWAEAEALNQLLWQTVTLPEPERCHYVVLLWEQFERLNEMIREIKSKGADADDPKSGSSPRAL